MKNNLGIANSINGENRARRQQVHDSRPRSLSFVNNAGKRDQVNFGSGSTKAANTLSEKATNLIIGYVHYVETHGPVVEFMAMDMLSMVIPRTAQAYLRNREELGHLNYQAGNEEAIRELLTGPSMFVMPMIVLHTAAHGFGPTATIPLKKLNLFSEELAKTLQNTNDFTTYEKTTEKFHKTIVDDIFSEQLNNAKYTKEERAIARTKVDEILKKLKDAEAHIVESQNQKSTLSLGQRIKESLFGGATKEAKQKTNTFYSEIQEIAGDINRALNHTPNHPYEAVFHQGVKGQEYKREYSDIAKDLMTYTRDIIHKAIDNNKGADKETIIKKVNDLNKKAVFGRKFTVATAIITTGLFLYSIPLLYKRNKEYPGVAGLKKDGQQEGTKSTVAAQGAAAPSTPTTSFINKLQHKSMTGTSPNANIVDKLRREAAR